METIVKIRTAEPELNKKEILSVVLTVVIAPAFSIWIRYKALHSDFSDLIRNIFTFKNSLKIDRSKNSFILPHCLEEIRFDNKKDKFFSGPPGTGKTFGASVLIAKQGAFCKETDGNIFNVESLVGTDITKINNFFKELERLSSENPEQKIVAVIDEFESIGDRSKTNQYGKSRVNSAVNLMLNKMDMIKRKYPNIYIIFTTNYREKIDNALLSRCTVQIPFELPSINMIEEILKNNFDSLDNNNSENKENYIELIKNDINKKNREEENISISSLLDKVSNYDEEAYNFWFGLLDFEITKR